MKNLIWFSATNLRVADNKILFEACKEDKPVLAVYCFDPRHYTEGDFGFKKTEKFRAQFLIESVKNLQENLLDLNISLLVYHKKPEEIIPQLIEEHGITNVFLQHEWTRDEREIVEKTRQKCAESVHFLSFFDQFLYHPDDIPYSDYQEIPKVFTHMRKRLEKEANVREPLNKPEPFSEDNRIEGPSKLPDLHTLGLDTFDKDDRSAFPFTGGEDAALSRIKHYFWETKNLSDYKKTRNGMVGTDYSSKLSAWLANGSISARTVYEQVKSYEKENGSNESTYWLIFELIWRDFFKYVSLKHGDALFHQGGILKKSYDWNNDSEVLKKWIAGKTKYDFVNANMREIAKTGFMSNRGRQNVASFWSKELKQDWRIGAAYFESMLIDYDVHSNWGNWMYNSGVGNDPRDRKFNITSQAQRYDSNGEYQQRWLQEELF
ncbi:DASH family cryptochrome [Flavimarina sp. Hel_I_48]|uniref:DASH family cryptochrome n=1 Tax=Flavimarina sp. Hel_I_48 TaxID=1392488 RepID=UPI0004DF8706|nr:DASH family cryptochrome [Flavimarina sp. Hel_I_48]